MNVAQQIISTRLFACLVVVCLLPVTAAQAATLPAVNTGSLVLHLDAGAGVSTSGGQVTQWDDQSGNGNHFEQTNAASRPVLSTNVINGLPGITFSNDRLDAIAGHGLNSATGLDFTFFAVTAGGTNPIGLFDSAPTLPNPFRFFGNNNVELWNQAPELPVTTDAAGSVVAVQGFLSPNAQTTNNRNLTRRAHSSSAGLDSHAAFSTNATQIAFTEPDIGTINGGAHGNFSGSIAEVLFYQGKLSSVDQLAVENYLRAKYDVNPFASGSLQQLPNPTIIDNAPAFSSAFSVDLALDGNTATDYASAGQGVNTFVDFDFGESTLITRVDYTDRTTSGAAQGSGAGGGGDNVTEYDLIFSQDSIFGNADDQIVSVLSPGFANTDNVLINGGDGIRAQYLRWDVTATVGGNPGAGEFAFFTTLVPEPGSITLVGLALVGLASSRRRRLR